MAKKPPFKSQLWMHVTDQHRKLGVKWDADRKSSLWRWWRMGQRCPSGWALDESNRVRRSESQVWVPPVKEWGVNLESASISSFERRITRRRFGVRSRLRMRESDGLVAMNWELSALVYGSCISKWVRRWWDDEGVGKTIGRALRRWWAR